MKRFAIGGFLGALALAGCDSGTEESRDVSSTRAIMRPHVPVPPGTVPRGASAFASALDPPGPSVTPALLNRGREQFAAFCSPCHGAEGRGDGPIVARGFPPPPSYGDERLRSAPREHVVSVITHGVGAMHSYAERIPPADRWAIASYVKELQSREAPGGAPPAP